MHELLIKPLDLIDAFNNVLGPFRYFFFRELFVIKDHHFLDGPVPVLQVIAHFEKRLDDQGRARKRLQDVELSALNAFGNRNLAFAGKERNCPHLAEIHADRVIGLVQSARRQIKLDILQGFVPLEVVDLFQPQAVGRLDFGRIQDLDTRIVEHQEKIVEIFRGMHVGRQEVVDLIIEEVTFLLPQQNELVNLVKLVVERQRKGLPVGKKNYVDKKKIRRHPTRFPAVPPSALLNHNCDKPSNFSGSTALDVIYTNGFACGGRFFRARGPTSKSMSSLDLAARSSASLAESFARSARLNLRDSTLRFPDSTCFPSAAYEEKGLLPAQIRGPEDTFKEQPPFRGTQHFSKLRQLNALSALSHFEHPPKDRSSHEPFAVPRFEEPREEFISQVLVFQKGAKQLLLSRACPALRRLPPNLDMASAFARRAPEFITKQALVQTQPIRQPIHQLRPQQGIGDLDKIRHDGVCRRNLPFRSADVMAGHGPVRQIVKVARRSRKKPAVGTGALCANK